MPRNYYLILEHLGNNDEETTLANGGFMIWAKMTTEYTQAVMGYDGDINYGSWQARGYQWPNLVTYAESHDEERMAYELTTYGNAFDGYDAKESPRPWIVWPWRTRFCWPSPTQDDLAMGELGYQISIFVCLNGSLKCKLDEKPAPWGDLANADRLQFGEDHRSVERFEKNQPVFGTYGITTSTEQEKASESICTDLTKNVVLVGNFDVAPINMVPGFPYVGTWRDHFTGQACVREQPGRGHDLQLASGTFSWTRHFPRQTLMAACPFCECGMHRRQRSELRSIGGSRQRHMSIRNGSST